MTNYTLFNLILATVFFATSVRLLNEWREFSVAVRSGFVMVLWAYPWDFIAIELQVWDHADPGARLFSVPVNDLIFIFLATYFAVSVFLFHRYRRSETSQRDTEAES